MKRRNLLLTAAWAAGSFGLTMMVLKPATLDATQPVLFGGAYINAAKLTAGGAELSLEYQGKTTSPDPLPLKLDSPLPLKLLAKNTSDTNVEVKVTIQLASTAPVSPMARTMSMPKQIWQHEQLVKLSPGESRTIDLMPDAKLTAGASVTAVLSCGEQAIQPLTWAVETPQVPG